MDRRYGRVLGAAAVPGLLVCVLVLNLLDALLTSGYLTAGLATEANPLMRVAWNSSPVVFFGLKLLMVAAGALILWTQRYRPLAQRATQLAVALYGLVVAFHLSHLHDLLPAVAFALR